MKFESKDFLSDFSFVGKFITDDSLFGEFQIYGNFIDKKIIRFIVFNSLDLENSSDSVEILAESFFYTRTNTMSLNSNSKIGLKSIFIITENINKLFCFN